MHFLINSTLSLDIIAMAFSVGLVVWSYQIKNGSQLAMVGGSLLFMLSILSLAATGFYGGKFAMHHDAMAKEHGLMQQMQMMQDAQKAPQ